MNKYEKNKTRFFDNPKGGNVRCSNCVHRKDKLKMSCDAYPDFIPKSERDRISRIDPREKPCKDDIYYYPDDGVWLIDGTEYVELMQEEKGNGN